MAKNSLTSKVSARVEDEYRDSDIELQFVAWCVREAPLKSLSVRTHWFSDHIYSQIVEVVQAAKTKLTDTLLFRQLKTVAKMSKDDVPMYRDTVKEVFREDLDTLTPKAVDLLAEHIRELYESRNIFEKTAEILSHMDDFDLEQSKEVLKELGRGEDVTDPTSEGAYMDGYDVRVGESHRRKELQEDVESGRMVGIPTGIPAFDRRTGGVFPGEWGVIAGRTGIGKTTTCINFGIAAWLAGWDVLIFSGEMSKLSLDYRLDAALSGVEAAKFRVGSLNEEDYRQWDATMSRLATQTDSVLYTVSSKRNFTVEDVERSIVRIREQTGRRIKCCFLDYLNIMSPVTQSKGSREWSSQADVAWDIKKLAAEQDMVVWAPNQVVDDAYGKELYDATDLKYARAISETAPIIIAMIQTEKDELLERMKLQTIKFRELPPFAPIVLRPDMKRLRLVAQPTVGKKSFAELEGDESLGDAEPQDNSPKKKTRKKS